MKYFPNYELYVDFIANLAFQAYETASELLMSRIENVTLLGVCHMKDLSMTILPFNFDVRYPLGFRIPRRFTGLDETALQFTVWYLSLLFAIEFTIFAI